MILLAVLAAVLFMLIGVPVFIVICGLAVYLFFISGIDLSAITIEMHRMATTPVLVAIPLFTFAGYLLSESGAPKRLIRLSNAVLGWLPGGLAVIALICCAVFTALTGATGLTIIALGGILLPAMTRGKYPEPFSLGLLTTSGTLGLLFPPSLPLIIYAIVAKVRIDHLFLAGLLPGLGERDGKVVIVGKQPGMMVAESSDDGAGQRRQIDDCTRLGGLLDIGEDIGQNEPAFGIGVEHFDGLAGH